LACSRRPALQPNADEKANGVAAKKPPPSQAAASTRTSAGVEYARVRDAEMMKAR
jgi:hypothetical protein